MPPFVYLLVHNNNPTFDFGMLSVLVKIIDSPLFVTCSLLHQASQLKSPNIIIELINRFLSIFFQGILKGINSDLPLCLNKI
jgi:hypothetical protein